MSPICPECESENVSVFCKVWLTFGHGAVEVAGEDADYAQPYPARLINKKNRNNAICRDCVHTFIVT